MGQRSQGLKTAEVAHPGRGWCWNWGEGEAGQAGVSARGSGARQGVDLGSTPSWVGELRQVT